MKNKRRPQKSGGQCSMQCCENFVAAGLKASSSTKQTGSPATTPTERALMRIAKLGVKIYVAAESVDFDSVSGRFIADINMALAAHYSRNLSAEVKKGIYGRLNQGFCPFRAPIGYVDNGRGKLKTLDPIKAPLVKAAFDLYCSGEYSITSLTEEMARRGLTGWSGRPVVRRNIETMIGNPFYVGKLLVCGKLYDGAHQTLITAVQFRQVKQIKAARTQKKNSKHERKYRGLLTCADCGKTLTGETQKTHTYYRCHTSKCSNGTIREDRLDAQIIDRLRRLELTKAQLVEVRARLRNWLTDTAGSELDRSIRLRIADANARQDRLTDLLVDGAITRPDFERRKQSAAFEQQRLQEELKRAEDQQKTEADLDDLVTLAANLQAPLVCGTPQEQRLHLKNCAAALCIKSGQLQLNPNPWLKELKRMSTNEDATPRPELIGKLASGQINVAIRAI
ncbi:MAG: recombinase zinc beta ribbon domain-containing protein [Pseudomonadota bacterium]